MKHIMLVLGTFIVLSLVLVSGASAATGTCTVSPASAPVGSTFTAFCSGFAPGETVTSWLTEPDGHAITWSGGRVDNGGNVAIQISTTYGRAIGRFAIGQWYITVQGSSALDVGAFFVTGSTKTVSGATLSVTDSGFVTGMGFDPGEMVTVWFDFPNDDCSGEWKFVGEERKAWGPGPGDTYMGDPIFGAGYGASTLVYGNFMADAGGGIAFKFNPFAVYDKSLCRGTYHIVARGNSSGNGGDTWWTTPNSSISANALLTAHPDTALAFGGHITFLGSGFTPNSSVSCWETTPQGGVIAAANPKTDSGGSFALSWTTGASYQYYPASWKTSEGAVGLWAMTCRDGDGNVGITMFTIVANPIDP